MTFPSLSIRSIKKDFLFVALPIISLGASVLLLFALIIPQITNIRKNINLQKSLTEKHNNLVSKKQVLEKLTDQETELNSHLKFLTNALPLTTSVPGLMSQVENIASKSAVSVASLQFAGATDYLSRKQEKSEETVQKGYQEFVLQVGVDCSLNSLQTFLANLENSSRIVSFNSFKFSPLGETLAEEGQNLRANVSLVAFYRDKPKPQTIEKAIEADITAPKLLELVNKIKNMEQYETGESLSF